MRSSPQRNRELGLLVFAIALVGLAYSLLQLSRTPGVPAGLAGYLIANTLLFGAAHVANRFFAPKASPVLLPAACLIQGLGYVLILRMRPDLAAAQGIWTAVGVGVFILSLLLLRDYRNIERYRYTWALLGLLALLLPLVPGIGREVNGSRLWVAVPGITFQPGEIAKVFLVFFFASYLREKRELLSIANRRFGPLMLPDPKHLLPILIAWGVSFAVLVLERDLGSSLLLFAIFLAMLYVGTGRAAYQVIGAGIFTAGAWLAFASFAHVRQRISIWLDPFADYQGSGYQLAQSLFALGTGGLTGTGLGQGSPEMIPFAYSDFIFSALGEELGLFGTAGLLVAFLALVGTGFRVALLTRDAFGKLLASGLTAIVAFQAFIIVGGVTRLIPLTGITLPFFSYGGSSLVANFGILAALTAISDQVDRPTVDLEDLATGEGGG